MSRNDTKWRLETALQRILDGKSERVPEHRKLSVRAVEEEANLGNGSGYYYPEVIEKIKAAKALTQSKNTGIKQGSELDKARQAKKTATRIKEQYRDKAQELLAEREQMAAIHHQLSFALRKAHKRIDELEQELGEIKQQLVETKRNNVTSLK